MTTLHPEIQHPPARPETLSVSPGAGSTGGPALPQERRLVTEIPGPRSRELAARRAAAVVNVVAAILFVCLTTVAWLPAALIAVGSIAGAQVGAVVGRRIPATVLRWIIVVVGVVVAILLFLRG